MLLPVLQGRLDDPRIALGPVTAVAGKQSDTIAVVPQPQPIAVVLDFVKSFGTKGTLAALVGMQNSNVLDLAGINRWNR